VKPEQAEELGPLAYVAGEGACGHQIHGLMILLESLNRACFRIRKHTRIAKPTVDKVVENVQASHLQNVCVE
jgi:hypothetical protein